MTASSNMDQSSGGQTVSVVGFGRRLAAALLDGLLVLFFTTVLAFGVSIVGITVAMFKPYEDLPFDRVLIWVGLIFSLIYYIGFWASSGQTIGKSTLGIQVVGPDGQPISSGKALLRYIGYLVSGIVASIGFLWLAFDGKRQGWHDKMAGTYVVYADEEVFDINSVELVPSDPGKSWIWIVVWIVVALAVPIGLFSSLLILGPAVNRIVGNMLGGLLG